MQLYIFIKIVIPTSHKFTDEFENKTFDCSTRHHGKCNARFFHLRTVMNVPVIFLPSWKRWGSSIYIYIYIYTRVDGHLSSSGRRCNYGFWHRGSASRLRVRHISRIIGCFIKRCHAHVACHSIIHSDIRRYFGVENREGRTRSYEIIPLPLSSSFQSFKAAASSIDP